MYQNLKTIAMEKTNRLIAEFMGMTPCLTSEGDFLIKGNPIEAKYLPYATDWNWLMPVVEKCMITGDDTDKWDNIFNTLSTLSINKVYKAVVQFIKELKQD